MEGQGGKRNVDENKNAKADDANVIPRSSNLNVNTIQELHFAFIDNVRTLGPAASNPLVWSSSDNIAVFLIPRPLLKAACPAKTIRTRDNSLKTSHDDPSIRLNATADFYAFSHLLSSITSPDSS